MYRYVFSLWEIGYWLMLVIRQIYLIHINLLCSLKLVIVTFLDLWMTYVTRKANVLANHFLLETNAKIAWTNTLARIVISVLIPSMDTLIAKVGKGFFEIIMNSFLTNLSYFSDCNCYKRGSDSDICDDSGQCECLTNFSGKKCFECADGYFKISNGCPCK